ncbi:MAG: glycosyltransferase family 9 protein [Cyanobacteria bacterium HKST-UBA02]|nr:glycosyltransferase family 9 protein [Cyanobacteria bacterium HKST-UBA02]
MKAPEHIVIFHPAAIGDAVLATPVAALLKRNFPDTAITYWSHSSLEPLIAGRCKDIDRFVKFEKKPVIALISQLRSLAPQLFVDLSNSLKGRILCLAAGCRTVSYRKEAGKRAADNFVDTIRPLIKDCELPWFPTLELPEGGVGDDLNLSRGDSIIGLVPGVGNKRPHRAWPREHWLALIQGLSREGRQLVLFGGPEEAALGEEIEKSSNGQARNLCGRLDIEKTAGLLARCHLVVAGDTGPAHIAVAVGTPVLGLYGPTLVERSGPTGYEHLALSRSSQCACLEAKYCLKAEKTGPGACMSLIEPAEVIERVEQMLQADASRSGLR